MIVLGRVGYVRQEDLGSDNTLMSGTIGPYLIKDSDFAARRIGIAIKIYPIVNDSAPTDRVPIFNAILTEQDYQRVTKVKDLQEKGKPN